jgi:Bax protein
VVLAKRPCKKLSFFSKQSDDKKKMRVNSNLMVLLLTMLLIAEVVGIFAPTRNFQFLDSKQLKSNSTSRPIIYEMEGRLKTARMFELSETERIDILFQKSSYKLAEIRIKQRHVPALFLWRLPNDLLERDNIEVRKKIFIQIMLPLILKQNSTVLKTRAQLEELEGKPFSDLEQFEKNWLLNLADYYKIWSPKKPKTIINMDQMLELKQRIDIIPVSLAIAQSALETGWGTSRFSLFGNALFGQWTWKEDQGIQPMDRDLGKQHSIRTFNQLSDSISDYTHNLNSSHFYQGFRAARAELRMRGNPDGLWGRKLTEKLASYSQNDGHYIRTIQTIIATNSLDVYEKSTLSWTPK